MNLINQSIEFVHLDYRTLKNFQGDLKGRTRQSMEKGSDKTRADQGITLEEAIRLYATETYKKEWYAKNSQTASK